MRGGPYLPVPSYSDLSFDRVRVFYARNAAFLVVLVAALLDSFLLGDGNSSIALLFKVNVYEKIKD